MNVHRWLRRASFILISSLPRPFALSAPATQPVDAHTLTYKITSTMPGGGTSEMKFYFASHGRTRNENGAMSTSISDGQHTLLLFPENHTAIELNLEGRTTPVGTSSASSMVDFYKHLDDGNIKPIGEKKIDGIDARGFTTTYAGMPATVWVNTSTSMPVEIQYKTSAGGHEMTMAMSDFQVDVPLDDSLFSLDVPAGYTVTKQTFQIPKLGPVEDAVASLMGDYAKLSNGNFPDSLTDWSALSKVFSKGQEKNAFASAGRIGGVSGQLFSLPNGYEYSGKSERLGAKDKVVFWIKPVSGAKTARVIFGDLRVADLPVESLPTTEPAP